MAKTEEMVPKSVAARMLTTGFEWEAGLFTEVYKELVKRMSKEEARDILGKAMYRAGYRLGVEAHQFSENRGPQGMAEAWDGIYGMGTKEADTLTEDRFTIHVFGCGAFDLMKRFGLSDEDIRFISKAYCSGDAGQAKGFDGQMHFQHDFRLMNGDAQCLWDYSSTEMERSSAAVPVEEFDKE